MSLKNTSSKRGDEYTKFLIYEVSYTSVTLSHVVLCSIYVVVFLCFVGFLQYSWVFESLLFCIKSIIILCLVFRICSFQFSLLLYFIFCQCSVIFKPLCFSLFQACICLYLINWLSLCYTFICQVTSCLILIVICVLFLTFTCPCLIFRLSCVLFPWCFHSVLINLVYKQPYSSSDLCQIFCVPCLFVVPHVCWMTFDSAVYICFLDL